MSGYGANQDCCCEVEPKKYVESLKFEKVEVPVQMSVKEQLENIQNALTETQLTLERIISAIIGSDPPAIKNDSPKCMEDALFSIQITAENCIGDAKRIDQLLMGGGICE